MSSGPSKKPTAATPSSVYTKMAPRWRMIDVLLGGTETMREAGDEFLPQHDNESQNSYQTRLKRATLLNLTEQTLDTLAGKPFKDQIVFSDDVPQQILGLTEDIDMQGSNLHAFCRAWFRGGWAKGLSHVLVEHPTPEAKVDAGGQEVIRTLADDRNEGLRPYWVHVPPENLIAAYSMIDNGKEVLTHVRIMEKTIERNGWEETVKSRVRVLEPGSWAVYAPTPKGDDWVLESEGVTALDYIPLVTFYAGKRSDLMECKPPLTDLAFLNISHWQSSSDQRNVLTVSRFPILAASGVAADTVVKIGPNNYLTTDDPTGKWYYVEHTGAAIAAGALDLERLEDQMASYGAEFLRKRPGDETATGRALDSAEASSYLAATIRDFQDCIEQALQLTAQWIGLETGGSVTLTSDVDINELDASELDALQKARAQRDISRMTYLEELKRRGVLADDFDMEADAELLAEEAENTLGGMFDDKPAATPVETLTESPAATPAKTPPDPNADQGGGE